MASDCGPAQKRDILYTARISMLEKNCIHSRWLPITFSPTNDTPTAPVSSSTHHVSKFSSTHEKSVNIRAEFASPRHMESFMMRPCVGVQVRPVIKQHSCSTESLNNHTCGKRISSYSRNMYTMYTIVSCPLKCSVQFGRNESVKILCPRHVIFT